LKSKCAFVDFLFDYSCCNCTETQRQRHWNVIQIMIGQNVTIRRDERVFSREICLDTPCGELAFLENYQI